MSTERDEPKSNSAVIAVVVVLGLLGALAVGVVLVGGVAFFYIARTQKQAEVAVMDMQRAMNPVPVEEPDLQSTPVAPVKPTHDELFDAAKKIVAAKLPNPGDVAWSDPKIEPLDDGWYRLSGALTTEGRSMRWACEILPVERNGQRDWEQKQLQIEE